MFVWYLHGHVHIIHHRQYVKGEVWVVRWKKSRDLGKFHHFVINRERKKLCMRINCLVFKGPLTSYLFCFFVVVFFFHSFFQNFWIFTVVICRYSNLTNYSIAQSRLSFCEGCDKNLKYPQIRLDRNQVRWINFGFLLLNSVFIQSYFTLHTMSFAAQRPKCNYNTTPRTWRSHVQPHYKSILSKREFGTPMNKVDL